jgi:predicted DCC family thiol-disulfide oxidoreductase YuxK
MSTSLEVFFDGSCPMCRREIAYYQRLDISRKLAWVDVSLNDAGCPDGYCQQDLLKRFHVRTTDGRMFSGAAGFALMWTLLPGVWKYAGHIASFWPVTSMLELAYKAFLPLRPWLQRRARAVLDN